MGSKRFILHAEQGMTALSAQLFCKQRYGSSARLAEILTVEEMEAVKELSLAVGVTGTARMCNWRIVQEDCSWQCHPTGFAVYSCYYLTAF